MMRKVLQMGFWSVLAIALFFTMSFVEKTAVDKVCDTLVVRVDYSDNNYFVSEESVIKILTKTDNSLVGKPLEEINIALLEENISKHPSVRNAEVYSTINGELRVNVKQKKPIARVITGRTSYYIDEEGGKMKLSTTYSARVPLVYGALKEERFLAVLQVLRFLKEEKYWKSQVISIEMKSEGLVIRPRFGAKEIIVGNSDNLDKKFEKLSIFYKKVIPSKGLDFYHRLDLRFENQVIGSK
jgi:cell division protein FtsQ